MPLPVRLRLGTALLLGFVLLLAFQNCESFTTKGPLASSARGPGDGSGFDGKIYVVNQACPGGTVGSAIRTTGAKSGELLRENCQDILPPKDVDVAVSEAGETLLYGTQLFHALDFTPFKMLIDARGDLIGVSADGSIVAKLGPDGSTKWARLLSKQFYYVRPLELLLDDDGNAVITGTAMQPTGPPCGFVARVSAGGELLARHTYCASAPGIDMFFGAVDDAGSLYVGGRTGVRGEVYLGQAFLMRIVNGDVDWVKASSAPGYFASVRVTPSRELLAKGTTFSDRWSPSESLLRLTTHGASIWTKKVAGDAALTGLAPSLGEDMWLTGTSAAARVSATGEVEWSKSLMVKPASALGSGISIMSSAVASNRLVLGGSLARVGKSPAAFITTLDDRGEHLGAVTYDSGFSAAARALTFDGSRLWVSIWEMRDALLPMLGTLLRLDSSVAAPNDDCCRTFPDLQALDVSTTLTDTASPLDGTLTIEKGPLTLDFVPITLKYGVKK